MLIILAAVGVLVVPAIGTWRDDFAFRDAVGRLEGALSLARVEAMREGRAVAVRGVPGEGSLNVGGREIGLGPGGRVVFLGPMGSPPAAEGGVLRFYPDGSADHGLIRLKGPRRAVDLVVNPLGGRSQIQWGEG